MTQDSYTPGSNTAYYEFEAEVCDHVRHMTSAKLKMLAHQIESRGTVAFVHELGSLLGIQEQN